MRYKFYTNKNENGTTITVCISHYAGKPVVGKAKCHADDVYDEEIGKQLAKARCDYKIARKRYYNARAKVSAANDAIQAAQLNWLSLNEYLDDSTKAFNDAIMTLEVLEDTYCE